MLSKEGPIFSRLAKLSPSSIRDNIELRLAERKSREEHLKTAIRQYRPLETIVALFPDITVRELIPRARLYLHPTGRSPVGCTDKVCISVIRDWVGQVNSFAPDVAERLNQELLEFD